jgi:ABC-type Mn2+/Zn2+ transport system permease subunit
MLQMVDLFSDSGFGANSLSYLLCITIGMEAITIGYNLAISPLYITEQFDVNSSTTVGLMLASGAALGTIISSFVTLTEIGKRLMNSYLPSPTNLIVSMGAIAVSVLIAAVPLFYIHIIGLMMLMAWNDFASILLNEMQGEFANTI